MLVHSAFLLQCISPHTFPVCCAAPRHRAKEFIRFLTVIDRCVQKHLDINLVLNN